MHCGQEITIFSPDDDGVVVIDSETYKTLNTFNIDLYIQGKYGWSATSKEFLILADYAQGAEGHNFELAKINMETGEITRLTFNDERESGADWAIIKLN